MKGKGEGASSGTNKSWNKNKSLVPEAKSENSQKGNKLVKMYSQWDSFSVSINDLVINID